MYVTHCLSVVIRNMNLAGVCSARAMERYSVIL